MLLQIAIITLLAHVSECHTSLETEVDSFLEQWRDDFGDNFSLPSSLKIFTFDTIESYYEAMGLRVNFSIYGMNLTGLDDFKINRLDMKQNEKQIFINISIDIPEIKLFSDHYKINGKAYYVYSLQGEGNMEIEFIDTTVLLNLIFKNVNQSQIIIEDDFNLRHIKASLQNASWLLNNLLNGQGVAMLKSYREDIANAIKYYVVPYVNDVYLAKLQPK